VPVILRGHFDTRRPRRLRRQRVDGEGMLRIHGRCPRSQQCACREFQHVVGAVAEDYRCLRNGKTAGDCTLEVESVAVGITPNVLDRQAHRSARPVAGPQWILVGSQLDDGRLLQAHLPGQLGNRLARLVGCYRADIGGRALAQIQRFWHRNGSIHVVPTG
jgi:hypothetical protein